MKNLRPLLGLFATVACLHVGAQTPSALPRSANDSTAPAAPHGSIAASNAAVFKACAAAPAALGVCPLDAVFGLFKLAPNNDVLDFKVSNTVPRVVNQNYGWTMKVNQMAGKVRVLERLTLPKAPKTWGAGGQPYGMSADDRAMSVDVTLTIYNGVISKSWDVADGDPAGHYLITAFVGNAAPVQFEFDVLDRR